MDSNRQTKGPWVIKFLIMALPIGTIILGAISFVFYFKGKDEKPMPDRELAAMLRKDIDQNDLIRHVETLSVGPRNHLHPQMLATAAAYLESTLGRMNMGYAVERQVFEVDEVEYFNLIAELPGTGKKADEIIVVGAHYDSAGDAPGADDNASGVAVLLGVAHAMTGTENSRTIRFVAFANEEPPFFRTDGMGSRVHARSCVKAGDNVVAMISLESLGYYTDEPNSQRYPDGLDAVAAGYPTTGNFLAVVGNTTSKKLVDGFVNAYQKHLTEAKLTSPSSVPAIGASLPPLMPWVNASDHWSYWQEDIPAIMVTDTAPLRNPHYHKTSDTPDTLDFDRMTSVARGVEAALQQLANP